MGGIVLLIILGLIYFIPSIVGRNKRNFNAILVLNIFLGWTLIGWVVALVWATTKDAPLNLPFGAPVQEPPAPEPPKPINKKYIFILLGILILGCTGWIIYNSIPKKKLEVTYRVTCNDCTPTYLNENGNKITGRIVISDNWNKTFQIEKGGTAQISAVSNYQMDTITVSIFINRKLVNSDRSIGRAKSARATQLVE